MQRPTNGAGARSDNSDMVDDLLKAYLREIREYPLLSPEDEHRLALEIDAGTAAGARLAHGIADVHERAHAASTVAVGEAAISQLTLANLRLVIDIATRYRQYGIPLLDLIQEGNLGLMEAAKRFDVHQGKRFSTYAVWWIRKYILQALRMQAPGGGGTSWQAAPTPLSLEQPMAYQQTVTLNQCSLPLGEFVADERPAPEAVLVQASARAYIARVLNQTSLPAKARRTIELRHGIIDGQPWSYTEIGREIGHSYQYARKLHHQARATLRQAFLAHQIEPDELNV